MEFNTKRQWVIRSPNQTFMFILFLHNNRVRLTIINGSFLEVEEEEEEKNGECEYLLSDARSLNISFELK